MPSTETTTILLCNNDGDKSTEGTLSTLNFDQTELTKRALTRLGLCWLASLGSLPIIFAHWVLVPGFFIAGPFMAVAAYKMKSLPDRVEGQCPVCDTAITIKLEPKDQFPKWTYCPSCKNSLHLKQPTTPR